MTETTVQEFRVGRVLARAWTVYMRNFVAFSAVSLVLLSPLLVIEMLWVTDVSADGDTDFISLVDIMYALLNVLLTQLVTATLVYGTIQEMRHQTTSTGEALTRGIQLALPVVGVALIVGILVGLASLLLIVPGIILSVMYWVAIPVAVVERPGVFASLKRSVFLTKGYRWRIFGVMALLWLILILVIIGIGLILELSEAVQTYAFVNFVTTVVMTVIFAVVSAVGYHDLRLLKDGVDVETIAAVFD